MQLKDIIWKYGNKVNLSVFDTIQENFNIVFPKEYKDIVLHNDGATPYPRIINGTFINNFIPVNPEETYNISKSCETLKSNIPTNVIPFAQDAFGNYFCFDFRKNKSNPSILFYDHETDNSDSLSFICNSFLEFLELLEEE